MYTVAVCQSVLVRFCLAQALPAARALRDADRIRRGRGAAVAVWPGAGGRSVVRLSVGGRTRGGIAPAARRIGGDVCRAQRGGGGRARALLALRTKAALGMNRGSRMFAVGVAMLVFGAAA